MPTNRRGENIFSSQMEFHIRGDSDKDRVGVPFMTFYCLLLLLLLLILLILFPATTRLFIWP